MLNKFYSMEEGEMKDYVVCKMACNRVERLLKMIQLVFIHSFEDKLELSGGNYLVMQAIPWSILMNGDLNYKLTPEQQTKYYSSTDKLLHLMQQTRLEVNNAIQKLPCYMIMASELY